MTTFSILTPTYNSESVLTHCLRSTWDQMVPREHLIVDGRSIDGTRKLVEKHSTHSQIRFISEPDKGPYDAINKGIKMATGDVIGILNSDDFFADDRVLESVAEIFEDSAVDSCYGDLDYVDREDVEKVVRRWKSGPYDRKNWYRGWMPPHPTFFVRRSVYEKYGFYRLDMSTSADYELMLRFMLKHGISTRYIPRVLVKMRTGGMSNISLKNRFQANLMDRKAWKVNGLKPKPWTIPLKPLRKIPQWF